MEHYIYVVFSATPYRMGRFIRKVTRQKYNHVSVALDDRLEMMYSFARYYKDTPLYGGFVKESRMRYMYKNVDSEICICAIPLSEEEYQDISTYIQEMKENRRQYLYNTFSAICTPMKFRVPIEKSYTCTEFVVALMAKVNHEVKADKFYTITELQDYLKNYTIYQGRMKGIADECAVYDEEFMKRHTVFSRSYLTFVLMKKLTYRFWRKSLSFYIRK